jgi:hypothetical protein
MVTHVDQSIFHIDASSNLKPEVVLKLSLLNVQTVIKVLRYVDEGGSLSGSTRPIHFPLQTFA